MDIQGEIQALEAHSRDVLANSEAINEYLRTLKQCQRQRDAILRTSQAATASASRMRHRVPSPAHAATPLPSARERSSLRFAHAATPLKITPSIKKSKKPKKRRTFKTKITDILPVGSTIHLVNHRDVTAIVQADGSIMYDGVSGSLSSTATRAILFAQHKYPNMPNGWRQWCYNGTPLKKLRM